MVTKMKLNKKELEAIARTYKYWKLQEDTQDYFEGMKMTLVTIGVLKQVENEIFKQDNKRVELQINTIESLIKKAYDKKHDYDCNKLDTYNDDIEFMQRLSNEEKTVLKNCIRIVTSNTINHAF